MNYLPDYRRGESLVGYSARCSSGRDLMTAVPSVQARLDICKEHANQMREAMRQPFTSTSKLSRKK